MTHLIYLLVETAQTSEEKMEMKQLVHDLVRKRPRSSAGDDTLLHLCVSTLNTINSSYFTGDDIQVSQSLNLELKKKKENIFLRKINFSVNNPTTFN